MHERALVRSLWARSPFPFFFFCSLRLKKALPRAFSLALVQAVQPSSVAARRLGMISKKSEEKEGGGLAER